MRFSTSNIVDANSWFRLGFCLLFFYIMYYTWTLLVVFSLVQSAFLLCFGQPVGMLGFYVRSYHDMYVKLLAYVLFLSDDKPYPFSLIPDNIQYYKRLFSQ